MGFLGWVVTWTDLDSMLLGHHWTRGILAGAGTGEGNVGTDLLQTSTEATSSHGDINRLILSHFKLLKEEDARDKGVIERR